MAAGFSVFCVVCLEETPCTHDTAPVFECVGCHATTCFKCIVDVLHDATQRVQLAGCPACGLIIQECQLATMASMHVTCRLIASYHVVFVRRTNSNARLCPHCAALNLQGSEQSPNMHCAACTKPFCFHHETQHGKRPCRGLTNEGGSSCLGALSSSFWKRCFTKKCPCCRVPIEKNGGCDHIRCTFCHADFCWFCKKSDSECRSRAHALKIVKKSFLALALLPVAIAAAPLVLVAAGGLAIVHLGSCRSS